MKIAYEGTAFHGEARQPGLRTVEGEVIQALARARVIRDGPSSRLQSASRTDRGVSALGNVVAFATSLAPEACVRSFNAKSRGVWAWAAALVSDDFNPRRARERWYRYLLPANHDVTRLQSALRVFEGEHDFRNFTRDRTRTISSITGVTVGRERDIVALDFRAPSFRWNLVRRIVAAALQAEMGRASNANLERALGAAARIDFGLAPPEPLVLMDVAYDFELLPVRDPTTTSRILRLAEQRARERWFTERLEERFLGARPD